jgi:hypothetical protein
MNGIPMDVAKFHKDITDCVAEIQGGTSTRHGTSIAAGSQAPVPIDWSTVSPILVTNVVERMVKTKIWDERCVRDYLAWYGIRKIAGQ